MNRIATLPAKATRRCSKRAVMAIICSATPSRSRPSRSIGGSRTATKSGSGGTVLTAHVTPGHTKGCTTWTLDVRDRGKTYHAVVVGGTTINPGTKVSGMPTYPNITRDF
jgi:hypothetical protein